MTQRQPQPPQRHDEEDSAEELEHISTRTLALTRYKRNHELMNEIFTHAAFSQLSLTSVHRAACSHIHTVAVNKQAPKSAAPYSIFDKAELENRAVRGCIPFP